MREWKKAAFTRGPTTVNLRQRLSMLPPVSIFTKPMGLPEALRAAAAGRARALSAKFTMIF